MGSYVEFEVLEAALVRHIQRSRGINILSIDNGKAPDTLRVRVQGQPLSSYLLNTPCLTLDEDIFIDTDTGYIDFIAKHYVRLREANTATESVKSCGEADWLSSLVPPEQPSAGIDPKLGRLLHGYPGSVGSQDAAMLPAALVLCNSVAEGRMPAFGPVSDEKTHLFPEADDQALEDAVASATADAPLMLSPALVAAMRDGLGASVEVQGAYLLSAAINQILQVIKMRRDQAEARLSGVYPLADCIEQLYRCAAALLIDGKRAAALAHLLNPLTAKLVTGRASLRGISRTARIPVRVQLPLEDATGLSSFQRRAMCADNVFSTIVMVPVAHTTTGADLLSVATLRALVALVESVVPMQSKQVRGEGASALAMMLMASGTDPFVFVEGCLDRGPDVGSALTGSNANSAWSVLNAIWRRQPSRLMGVMHLSKLPPHVSVQTLDSDYNTLTHCLSAASCDSAREMTTAHPAPSPRGKLYSESWRGGSTPLAPPPYTGKATMDMSTFTRNAAAEPGSPSRLRPLPTVLDPLSGLRSPTYATTPSHLMNGQTILQPQNPVWQMPPASSVQEPYTPTRSAGHSLDVTPNRTHSRISRGGSQVGSHAIDMPFSRREHSLSSDSMSLQQLGSTSRLFGRYGDLDGHPEAISGNGTVGLRSTSRPADTPYSAMDSPGLDPAYSVYPGADAFSVGGGSTWWPTQGSSQPLRATSIAPSPFSASSGMEMNNGALTSLSPPPGLAIVRPTPVPAPSRPPISLPLHASPTETRGSSSTSRSDLATFTVEPEKHPLEKTSPGRLSDISAEEESTHTSPYTIAQSSSVEISPATCHRDDFEMIMDVVDRLCGLGVSITKSTATGATLTVTFHMLRANEAQPFHPTKVPGKAPLLRDVMREMQDKSHTRDERRLESLGGMGYLEISVLSLLVSTCINRDELTASFACQTIGNLAMITVNRARLADLGAIEAVVQAMNSTHDALRVQKDAVVALRHLAYENDGNKMRIIHTGGIRAVISIMNECSEGPLALQVHRQCCGALSIFAVHSTLGDVAKREIVEMGAVYAVIRTMRIHSTDLQLVVAAAKALGTLASRPEARSMAREAGCFDLFDYLAAQDTFAYSREFNEAARHALRRLRGQ